MPDDVNPLLAYCDLVDGFAEQLRLEVACLSSVAEELREEALELKREVAIRRLQELRLS